MSAKDRAVIHDFLDFLVANGVVQPNQAAEIRRESHERTELIGQMLLRRQLLTVRQVMDLLAIQAERPHMRLGQIAVAAGYLAQADLDAVLRKQPSTRLDPLDLILKRDLLDRESLLQALVAFIKADAHDSGADAHDSGADAIGLEAQRNAATAPADRTG